MKRCGNRLPTLVVLARRRPRTRTHKRLAEKQGHAKPLATLPGERGIQVDTLEWEVAVAGDGITTGTSHRGYATAPLSDGVIRITSWG